MKKTSEIMAQMMAGYLINGCDGCPFYGIEEYEIDQYCDSVPLNCKWAVLWKYFESQEAEDEGPFRPVYIHEKVREEGI